MLMSNTQNGQSNVIRGTYNIQYIQFFSVNIKDKSQLPALAHEDPPKANVVNIRVNCHQFTPHLFFNR